MNINTRISGPAKSDSTNPAGGPARITNSPKRVLLVDADEASQARRAGILRQSGVEVSCADDFEHAQVLWQADTFSLVMIDATNVCNSAVAFQKSIQAECPRQLVKFLVGRPALLSDSPLQGELPAETEHKISAMKKAHKVFASASVRFSRDTGIMNAAAQISTRRSLYRLQSLDRTVAKTERELSFGEAVRRAEGPSR